MVGILAYVNISYVVYILHNGKVSVQKDKNAVLKTFFCTIDSESFMKVICSECKKRCIVYDKSNQRAIVDLRRWVRMKL